MTKGGAMSNETCSAGRLLCESSDRHWEDYPEGNNTMIAYCECGMEIGVDGQLYDDPRKPHCIHGISLNEECKV